MTSDNIAINSTNFQVDKNGNVTANSLTSNNATITGGNINLKDNGTFASGKIKAVNTQNSNEYSVFGSYGTSAHRSYNGDNIGNYSVDYFNITNYESEQSEVGRAGIQGTLGSYNTNPELWIWNSSGRLEINSSGVYPPSLATSKKNFEKLSSGLNIIRNIDIYKYNFKSEDDNTKKHIGFVIGDKYNYSQEITSEKNDSVDLYSFISICCKAIQEQQEEIEQLKEQINKMEVK